MVKKPTLATWRDLAERLQLKSMTPAKLQFNGERYYDSRTN